MGRGGSDLGKRIVGRSASRAIGRITKPFYQVMDSVIGTNMSGKFGKPSAPDTQMAAEPEITAQLTPETNLSQNAGDGTDTGLGDVVSVFADKQKDDWDDFLDRYKKKK